MLHSLEEFQGAMYTVASHADAHEPRHAFLPHCLFSNREGLGTSL